MSIFPKLHRPRNDGTVLLLGAGASFGASISPKTPMNGTFVASGKRMLGGRYDVFWRLLEKLGYRTTEDDSIDLENLYSRLHILSSGLWLNSTEEYLNQFVEEVRWISPAELCRSFIIDTLTPSSRNSINSPCKDHMRLFASLKPGDTVISLNYDLIADSAMFAARNWDERTGYGFTYLYPFAGDGDEIDEFSQVYGSTYIDLQSEQPDVALLKLHGSIHWTAMQKGRTINDIYGGSSVQQMAQSTRPTANWDLLFKPIRSLANSEYIGRSSINGLDSYMELGTALKESGQELPFKYTISDQFMPLIVPPSAFKLDDLGTTSAMSEMWSYAHEAISRAERIIFIGYSFPNTDLHLECLFQSALLLNPRHAIDLQVVNPDEYVSNRLRGSMPKGSIVWAGKFIQEFEIM